MFVNILQKSLIENFIYLCSERNPDSFYNFFANVEVITKYKR